MHAAAASGSSFGLAAAPPSPEAVAEAYAVAPPALRGPLLACLLAPLGPLAVAAVASGAFVRFVVRGSVERLVAAADDLGRFGIEQVLDLARFAAQVDPAALVRAGALIAAAAGTALHGARPARRRDEPAPR